MRRIENLIRSEVPNLFTQRLFELIFPNLCINVKIRLANNIGHARFYNFKAVFFEIFFNIMIGTRMKIEQILADDENRRSASTAIIRHFAHDVNCLFETAAYTKNTAALHAVNHGIHGLFKCSICTAGNAFVRAHFAQQFLQNINHRQRKRNIER